MDLIVGDGKYGCKAVEYLRQKNKSFVVVDVDSNCLAVQRFRLKPVLNPNFEGEHFTIGGLPIVIELIDNLKPEYIFPTAPVHVAADTVGIKFNLFPWNEAIDSILPKVPQAVDLHAGRGKVILRFNSDHICVENCAMSEICPSSGTQKPCTITKLMRYASPKAFILISHSKAPDMGALKGSELSEFFEWVKPMDRFIVGTACDCHGVFPAFQKSVSN